MSLQSHRAVQPLNPIRWIGGPLFLCMLGTLVLAAPIRIFGFGLPEPVFVMAPAFAWALIRPSMLAPLALLLSGLFLDIFWGGPLGLWGLSLLVGYGGVLILRSIIAGQSYPALWTWFTAMTALSMGTAYLVSMILTGTAPNLLAVVWQFLPTALLYPFANRLIERFEDADVRFR